MNLKSPKPKFFNCNCNILSIPGNYPKISRPIAAASANILYVSSHYVLRFAWFDSFKDQLTPGDTMPGFVDSQTFKFLFSDVNQNMFHFGRKAKQVYKTYYSL